MKTARNGFHSRKSETKHGGVAYITERVRWPGMRRASAHLLPLCSSITHSAHCNMAASVASNFIHLFTRDAEAHRARCWRSGVEPEHQQIRPWAFGDRSSRSRETGRIQRNAETRRWGRPPGPPAGAGGGHGERIERPCSHPRPWRPADLRCGPSTRVLPPPESVGGSLCGHDVQHTASSRHSLTAVGGGPWLNSQGRGPRRSIQSDNRCISDWVHGARRWRRLRRRNTGGMGNKG